MGRLVTGWVAVFAVGLGVGPGVSHAQTAAPAAAPAVYTAAQATRGKALYDFNCAMCHAPDLAGAPMAPPLGRDVFLSRRRTFRQLFDYVQLNMPVFSPNGLSRQQNADILAYMLQHAGFPAGSKELPTTSEAQETIKLGGR